jgi:hypothetical protein
MSPRSTLIGAKRRALDDDSPRMVRQRHDPPDAGLPAIALAESLCGIGPATELRAWLLEKLAAGQLSYRDVAVCAHTVRCHPDLNAGHPVTTIATATATITTTQTTTMHTPTTAVAMTTTVLQPPQQQPTTTSESVIMTTATPTPTTNL